MPRRQWPHPETRYLIALIGAFLALVIGVPLVLFETGDFSFSKGGFIVIIYAVALLVLIFWLFRKRQRRIAMEIAMEKERIAITSELDKHLRKALETMDTTAKWYNDEDEANRELVTCLKAQGVEAQYQYRLPNGRTADAKVYDFLIEGKLSPDTAEVDRLIGQLSQYSEYPYKINVVIYGELSKDAKRRIENEIHLRYDKKVFLTCLDNPKRQRAYYYEE
jgi:membrane protein implicated in regulation of membrane protease activity